ncbi:MAG: tRNA (guanosine(37)-N1)-methyltransferase TrmD [Gammaproteobacteria bacterium]|nr:tRNA (guanosine(37)-N1)-methyltransferase TrmD [Gammaproteobacteria bacterium]
MHYFSLVTLFPEIVDAYCAIGIIRKARAAGLVDIATFNPRDFTNDERRTVDDLPYGGGPGMVMQVAPLRAAITAARERHPGSYVVYLSPQGQRLEQGAVNQLLANEHLILVAGRYEGIDERVVERDIDAEWSIGDYVLSGGELPALVLLDAIVRQIPDVLGDPDSAQTDSFMGPLLDFPHYTRPDTVDGQTVPFVLLSGNHAAIATWRLRAAVSRTLARRPDLLYAAELDDETISLVRELSEEISKKAELKG